MRQQLIPAPTPVLPLPVLDGSLATARPVSKGLGRVCLDRISGERVFLSCVPVN
jgi:hypothetical protein